MERPARSRWPIGLLGMIALVMFIEAGLVSQPLCFVDTVSLNWRLSADDVSREAQTCEIACLGDSLMKITVHPQVLRARTGKSAFNFGMARAPAPATYYMLRRLLDSGGHPSAVVVEFKPSLLVAGLRTTTRQFQETLSLWEAWDLVRETGAFEVMPPILLGRCVPSIRSRLVIREAIRSALDGQSAPTLQANRIALRNWSMNLGAHLNTTRSTFSGEIPNQIHQWFSSDDWHCHWVNERYMNRFFDLAKSRKIPVYWVIPPLPPTLQERRERSGVDAKFVSFVRAMQSRHPEVTIVDGRRSGYETAVFTDFTHLNGRGSMAVSQEVASILAQPEGRPRWIELPRFRDWPVDVPTEDTDQSRIAVESGTVLR